MKLIPEDLKIQTFPCPNCGQIVSSEVDICKFCSTPLSSEMKQEAINKELNEQEKLNLSWHKNIMIIGIGILMFGLFLFISSIVQLNYSKEGGFCCLGPISIIAGLLITAKGYIRYREEKQRL
jgi:hypothetical protein